MPHPACQTTSDPPDKRELPTYYNYQTMIFIEFR